MFIDSQLLNLTCDDDVIFCLVVFFCLVDNVTHASLKCSVTDGYLMHKCCSFHVMMISFPI